MASHGVPRNSEAKPRTEQARQKELQGIQEYKALVDAANSHIHAREHTLEALQLTSKLLVKNPEYYTIWNHRRRILQQRFRLSVADRETNDGTNEAPSVSDILTDDLRFLVPLLIKFPKCYWMWNHRLWLLEQSTKLLSAAEARRFWSEELGLVSKMLVQDSRNFHGWGYRRTVIAALESESLKEGPTPRSLVKDEFNYTTRMIKSNLSNFSAWHNRSSLIPRLLDEDGADAASRRNMLDDELTLIQEALYTDPYDQSIWFYHLYLATAFSSSVSLSSSSVVPDLTEDERHSYLDKEIAKVVEMLEDTTDCKWIYQSLVQLAEMYRESSGTWPEAAGGDEVQAWLTKLMTLDPLRKRRWLDLQKRVHLEQ